MKFNKIVYQKNIGVEDQNLVVKFAHARLVNGKWQNQSDLSECRDFMGDCLYATDKNMAVEIYGFRFDPKATPLYKNKLAIAIEFPDAQTRQNFVKNLPHFWPTQEVFQMLDKWRLDLDANICVLTFDKLWNKSVFGLSYLTFLLKCMCYELNLKKDLFEQISQMTYEQTCTWSGDVDILPIKEAKYVKDTRQYIDKLNPMIEYIMQKQGSVHGIVGTEVNTNHVHNDTGFYSTFKWKKTEPYNLFKENQNGN